MPFTAFTKDLKPREATRLYTAQQGDQHVSVHSNMPGDENDYGESGMISFLIGGPKIEKEGGLFCASGEWDSQVLAGDEVWALIPGNPHRASGSDTVPLTVLVRYASGHGQRKEDDAEPAPRK